MNNGGVRKKYLILGAFACAVIVVLGLWVLRPSKSHEPTTVELNLAAQTESEKPIASNDSATSRPALLVAAKTSGELVTLDAKSGAQGQALGNFGSLLGGLALNADSSQVYFDSSTANTCAPSISMVPVKGGNATFVVSGSAPAISNDGSKLAYVRHIDCKILQIAVRDLATGAERTIGTTTATQIPRLTWSPDKMVIVADLRYADASRTRLALVKSDSIANVDSTPNVRVGLRSDGTVYEWPAFMSDGRLFVAESCCAGKTQTSSRLQMVDTRRTDSVNVLAVGIASKTHTATAVDRTGAHFLYVSGDSLMVADRNQRPSPIATGVIAAVWK